MATKTPAKTKAPTDYNSKLYIGNEMAAFDRKDRGYFDSMSDEEQKSFSPFLMIRWGATVDSSEEMQEYYLRRLNQTLNRYFFNIGSQHKKLQWLLATTVSPGMGKQRHTWLAAKKRESGNNKAEKFLRAMYPDYRDDEIKLLAEINTKDDLKELALTHGWTNEQIKKEL